VHPCLENLRTTDPDLWNEIEAIHGAFISLDGNVGSLEAMMRKSSLDVVAGFGNISEVINNVAGGVAVGGQAKEPASEERENDRGAAQGPHEGGEGRASDTGRL
jgi:hypothetical protein